MKNTFKYHNRYHNSKETLINSLVSIFVICIVMISNLNPITIRVFFFYLFFDKYISTTIYRDLVILLSFGEKNIKISKLFGYENKYGISLEM
jgi:hypothetical protein